MLHHYRLHFFLQNPQGKALVPRMDQIEDGTYAVSFVPDECGPYNVSIKYGDKDVIGSPFTLQAHPTGEVSERVEVFRFVSKKNCHSTGREVQDR